MLMTTRIPQHYTGPTSQELPTSLVGLLNQAQAIEIVSLTVNSASTLVINLLAPVISESAINSVTSASVVNLPPPVDDFEPTEIQSQSHSSSSTIDSFYDLSPSRAPDDTTESVHLTARNGDTDLITHIFQHISQG